MKDERRVLLLFSGTGGDFNRVQKIAGMDRRTDFDLLHVSGINGHSLQTFPLDIFYDIYRNAKNIVGLYTCDGHELGRYIRENCRSVTRTAMCQCCQMGLNALLARLIKEKGYKRVIYCSPQFDRKLYRIPVDMILDETEYADWQYPVTDYGIVSREVRQKCICDTRTEMDPDLLMDEKSMREFCTGIIDSGILDRLSMEEAEVLPF